MGIIYLTKNPSESDGARYRASLPMPEGWNGDRAQLVMPDGLTWAMLDRARDLIREWEEDGEPSTLPLSVLLYRLFTGKDETS
jgi:hypothetical protein